ncbi:thioredoxin [Paenibacillus albiflavus]|uniref:Thioredoxin n=1 Tax=Paenibacillus albiflavus TaxID=2545760 RepID=A0A4R4E223_9BACL|nr:thioredoxin family protein [Paenibacillus albiflavus]TCZ73554.1 thioredoxin [Paenibacillus albiflavus]
MTTITLNKHSFNEQINHGVALVNFYTPSCDACQKQMPIVDELATEIGRKAMIAHLNMDDEAELAAEFKVTSAPTILLFKDGYVIEKLMGLQSKDLLKQKVDQILQIARSCAK